MVCGACATRVPTVAKRVDGVGDVVVSHAHGMALITYDPAKTNPAAIAQVVTHVAGFTSEVTTWCSAGQAPRSSSVAVYSPVDVWHQPPATVPCSA